ncbi:MAG: hypothetical protein ABDH31_05105 [Chlorobiota bacterium]
MWWLTHGIGVLKAIVALLSTPENPVQDSSWSRWLRIPRHPDSTEHWDKAPRFHFFSIPRDSLRIWLFPKERQSPGSEDDGPFRLLPPFENGDPFRLLPPAPLDSLLQKYRRPWRTVPPIPPPPPSPPGEIRKSAAYSVFPQAIPVALAGGIPDTAPQLRLLLRSPFHCWNDQLQRHLQELQRSLEQCQQRFQQQRDRLRWEFQDRLRALRRELQRHQEEARRYGQELQRYYRELRRYDQELRRYERELRRLRQRTQEEPITL